MTLINLMQLTAFAFLLSSGQVLFKKAALDLPPLMSKEGVIALVTNLWFWLAMALYGAATLLWIVILQKVSLSLAYPFVALGFIIVPLASWVLFKEPLSLSYAGGVALILAGLAVVTFTGGQHG